MFVGVAEFAVFIPHSGSLKAKRSALNSMKGRIKSRFNAAVSEVDGQDLWQRATLGVSVVGADPGLLEETLRAIRRVAERVEAARIVDFRLSVVPWSFGEPELGCDGGSTSQTS